jgi:hypothetical protein
MKKLYKPALKKKHWELWDRLYNYPHETKGDALNALGYNRSNNYPCCECWACEWMCQHKMNNCEQGKACPLDWIVTISCLDNGKSYYDKWGKAKNFKIRKKYAKLIRDLPLKKNMGIIKS